MKFIRLSKGKHEQGHGIGCAMEAVSALNGEMWSDAPTCVDPVIAAFVRTGNDSMQDDATRAKFLAPKLIDLIGTQGTKEDSFRRAYIAADYAVRRFVPIALRRIGLLVEAEKLEVLPEIVDKNAAEWAARAAGRAAEAAEAARAAWVSGAAEAAWAARAAGRAAESACVAEAAESARAAGLAADAAVAAGLSAEWAARAAGNEIWPLYIKCLDAMIAAGPHAPAEPKYGVEEIMPKFGMVEVDYVH